MGMESITELNLGSAAISDEELLSQFEGCIYPNDKFKHLDHIRLAWIYLRHDGYRGAESRMRASIARFAEHCGATRKYHETVTIAWMRLVQAALEAGPRGVEFRKFLDAHPQLGDKSVLSDYFSKELLSSEAARQSWMEPDIRPLPPLETSNHRAY